MFRQNPVSWFRDASNASSLEGAGVRFEALESRQLMSVTLPINPGGPIQPVPPIVIPITSGVTAHGVMLHLTAGAHFSGDLGALTGVKGAAPDLSNLHAIVDWGDGSDVSTGQLFSNKLGHIHVTGQHTYSAAGDYSITVTVTEGPIVVPGQPNPFFAIKLAEIDSKAVVTGNSYNGVTIHEVAGVKFTATLGSFNVIAPAENLKAIITWGDGTSSTGTLSAGGIIGVDVIKFDVSGEHTYAKAGKYPIVVTVTQSNGIVGSEAPIRLVTTIDSTAIVSAKNAFSLNGTVSGAYSKLLVNPDVSGPYEFSGAGSVGDLGAVKVTGSVTLPGFIASGRAKGSLLLSNSRGSLTLSLTGPLEVGFGPFPGTFDFVVSKGTGAYAADTGVGTISATLITGTAQKGSFTFKIHSAD